MSGAAVSVGPVELKFVVPRGWHRVPRAGAEVTLWIERITSKSPPESRAMLSADLRRLSAISLGDPRACRTHLVYVRNAFSTTSEAHLTIDYYSAGPGAFEAYSGAALDAADSPRPSAVYAQRCATGVLAGAPAVVTQDFLIEGSDARRGDLQERYLAAIFPRALGVLIEIQLTSPDLALFGDIVDYGNGIVSSLTWEARG